MPDRRYKTLDVSTSRGVSTARINNPFLNVLDADLLTDIDAFAGSVRVDAAVRVVVFESADPDFFIPHGDMRFVDNPSSFADLKVAMDEDNKLNPMQRVFERVRKLPQVTIGKLSGYARGGGAEFLAALDMRFAGREHGKLAQMEAATGIIPGAGGTVYLPRLVGRARALEIILSSELVDAEWAELYGWINRAIPDGALDEYVSVLAEKIAGLAPGVIAATKIAVDAASEPISRALEVQNEQLAITFAKPAAAALTRAALAAGAQTRAGERHLERLLAEVQRGANVAPGTLPAGG